ncbi:PAS domain-containing sensor histidine kinase [Halorhabdus sp. CUG00001]|uniref:PAS domain-containing sensor histidine kinase n=1 Tax=Halorhabdus sp. CUG00001 TaxID=2600297 RepID=UPI00131AF267|nr:PAS domain-containing sensor histidine kinase [Halorhabdus sp. CUG00001]
MGTPRRMLALAAGLGIGVWVLDAVLDALLFYSEMSFLAVLVTDVPAHELYIRVLILAVFVAFGLVTAVQASRMQEREREATLFRRLVDEATDSVYVIDPETGRITDVNDRACETLGYDRSALLGRSVAEINPEFEDPQAFAAFIDSAGGQDIEYYETTHVRADGTTFPVEISAATVDIDGRAYRIAIARDVTERKAIVAELKQSEQRYESLFDSIRDAILVADTDRHIVDCNPAFTELFGYTLEEIEGESTALLYESEAEFEAIGETLDRQAADPTFVETVRYEKQSGQVFPGETNIFYRRTVDGEITGYIGLVRDVSDRQARMTQIRTIDRVLRHNLNNALTVILGNAESIADKEVEDPQWSAQRIIRTGERLQATTRKEREITTFLSESRPTVEHDGVTIVESAVTDVREEYPHADLTVERPASQPVVAVTYIDRAIEELLENAVTHSDRATPSVQVSLATTDGVVEISVEDDGPGMPEMERDVLTGDRDIEPLYHGRGIGLWLVHLIVQYSDGTVTFEENEPRGSVVTIRLPTPSAWHADEQMTE